MYRASLKAKWQQKCDKQKQSFWLKRRREETPFTASDSESPHHDNISV